MALPNDSVEITAGSGAVIAAHTIAGKKYQVVIPAGPHGHLVDSTETWIAWANDVAFEVSANLSHFSFLNTEATKVIHVHKLFAVNLNVSAITGTMFRMDVMRITGHSGGADITPEKFDSANSALPAGITIKSKATVSGEGARLFGFPLQHDEIGATGAIIAGTHVLQGLNLLFESPRIQELTLRQNQGFHIKQVTAAAVAGLYGYACIFSIRDA